MSRRIHWRTIGHGLYVWILISFAAVTLALTVTIAFASGAQMLLLGMGTGYNSLSTTVTVGEHLVDGSGNAGYCSSATYCLAEVGSISTSSIPGGYTIESIEETAVSGNITEAEVVISGYSSSPGASWLGAVTFNSHTFSGSTASYSYSGGVATWEWSTSTGWAWTDGDEYAGTVGYQ